MQNRSNRPVYHIIYWVFVTLILSLVFGRSWGNRIAAFYYISLLLPIVMGTSYFFNYFLVPHYLLTKKYFRFGLYFFYTLVVSLYFEIIVLMFAFVYLVNFNFGAMNPNARDTLLMAVVLYLLVFLSSFLLMAIQLAESKKKLTLLMSEQEKFSEPFLELTSQRKKVRVPFDQIVYIESLADYIKINTLSQEEIISKEKISTLEKRLPSVFLRIHRSFIINIRYLNSHTYNEVVLRDSSLPVGRSYKKEVRKRLNGL